MELTLWDVLLLRIAGKKSSEKKQFLIHLLLIDYGLVYGLLTETKTPL